MFQNFFQLCSAFHTSLTTRDHVGVRKALLDNRPFCARLSRWLPPRHGNVVGELPLYHCLRAKPDLNLADGDAEPIGCVLVGSPLHQEHEDTFLYGFFDHHPIITHGWQDVKRYHKEKPTSYHPRLFQPL